MEGLALINPVCADSDCERRVFSDSELRRGVWLSIVPDYCEEHELDNAGRIRQPAEAE